MHPRTIATLDQLRGVEWFHAVGKKDRDAVEILSSWDEAVASCSSDYWEGLCLEAANQYRERLVERSRDRFVQWNDIVAEVKPHTMELVREKVAKVVVENTLPKVFIDTVDWDILHLCMEAEYADVYPVGFYASLSYWYANGRFPCGWVGVFPKGRQIIF